ncbi:hypothetical protein GS399_02150 [Pedobacter sp. HMF7647]|uniref:MoaD/ThiS family protein n=1 Tax=Hufsiella arboris TaxID=2695275 RepID=A0A7K1Y593_9SPHI|nr:MoaD/ThiS family protein [Hufsiella arboris]MXV49757.1 hypothetical protein [Hufsiella arboris]
MKIQLFASLKDFFGKELDIDQSISSVESLRQFLETQNPQSASLLKSCRFAVKDEFVANDYLLTDHDIISVIPPSSGG